MGESKIDIYRYLDYRSFLKDLIEDLRSRNEYSQRSFAKQAGLGSPSFLRMVINGERNLKSDKLEKVSKALGLENKEIEFFDLLVQFDQSKSLLEKNAIYEKILKFSKFRKFHELAQDQYHYFSHWYLPTILEALSTKWAKHSEEVQAWAMGISVTELKNAFGVLERLGLIEKKSGSWLRKEEAFQTAPETASLYVRNFHRQMGERALESLDEDEVTERQFVGLTIALSDEEFAELKSRLFNLLVELNEEYTPERRSKKRNKIFQVNIQAFPVVDLE